MCLGPQPRQQSTNTGLPSYPGGLQLGAQNTGGQQLGATATGKLFVVHTFIMAMVKPSILMLQ